MRRKFWTRLAAAAAGVVVTHAPAHAGDYPPGVSPSGTKARQHLDRLYIHQFKGPTIAPGSCYGYFATKWTPWEAACPGGNCGPNGVPVVIVGTPPAIAADETKPADPPAVTPTTPPAVKPSDTVPMSPKPIELGPPKVVIPAAPGTTPRVPEVIMPKPVVPPLDLPKVPVTPEKKGGDPGRAAMIQIPDSLAVPVAAAEPQLLAPPVVAK